MMYYLNKIVWYLANPIALALIMVAFGVVCIQVRKVRRGWMLIGAAILGLSVLSMPIVSHVLGRGLERNYREVEARDFPHEGDVALDLGGSWVRSWYAAELVKQGKAKVLIPTGCSITNQDTKLIFDLGVSRDKVWIEPGARNTEENIKFAKQLYEANSTLHLHLKPTPKILLVTSAVHMPRATLFMQKYWTEAEVIPAPCDFVTTHTFEQGWRFDLFRPNLCSYVYSEAFLHEYVGYFVYRYLRK